MHAAKHAGEGAAEQGFQFSEIPGQAVDVSDELDLIFQWRTLYRVMGPRFGNGNSQTNLRFSLNTFRGYGWRCQGYCRRLIHKLYMVIFRAHQVLRLSGKR